MGSPLGVCRWYTSHSVTARGVVKKVLNERPIEGIVCELGIVWKDQTEEASRGLEQAATLERVVGVEVLIEGQVGELEGIFHDLRETIQQGLTVGPDWGGVDDVGITRDSEPGIGQRGALAIAKWGGALGCGHDHMQVRVPAVCGVCELGRPDSAGDVGPHAIAIPAASAKGFE